MSYRFNGRLCGRLCEECLEQLSDVTIRIYRNRKDQNTTALAVADPGFGAPPMPSGSFLPIPNFFFRGGNGGPHNGSNTGGFPQNIAGDDPCAYSVSLAWSTREYLTSGTSTQILYCK